MQLSAGKYRGMRRLADRQGRFKMTAVDQRPPIKNLIRERRGTAQAPWEDVAGFKELLIRELQGESTAMLLDPHYAYPRGVTMLDPALGMILTLEDSLFTETPGGRLSAEIDDWSTEKIKRAGGDAVKVLTWYRPDADPAVCEAQQAFTARIGDACRRYDLPFVFELLVYPLARDAEQTRDYVEMKTKHPDLVLDSVRAFADPKYGVDLFKLESPIPASDLPEPGSEGAPQAQALLRIGMLRVVCHASGLTRVVVQDAAVRMFPVMFDKNDERRTASVVAGSSYDREMQTLRIDIPRGEGAVEFLIRTLPQVFDN